MKYGFEIVSILSGIIIILAANYVVIEIMPFIVPIMNMAGGLLIALPPMMGLYLRYKTKKEIEEQFISFIMDLNDSIESGMSLPLALEHCSKRDYLSLSRHINHLVSQVNWGVPFRKALKSFAKKSNSKHVQRAVSTIIETYRVGGKISDTLNSVAKSMTTINKLNAERRASVYSQVVTSYMIFFVFIFLMVVIQIFILPSFAPSGSVGPSIMGSSDYGSQELLIREGGSYPVTYIDGNYQVRVKSIDSFERITITVDGKEASLESGKIYNIGGLPVYVSSIEQREGDEFGKVGFLFGENVPVDFTLVFTVFIIIQGFFAGLATGKMSEGTVTAGFKHSLILVSVGYIIFSLASQLPQIKLF